MTLALHIRPPVSEISIDRIADHLAALYQRFGFSTDKDLVQICDRITKRPLTHIYVGDEFCVHRLPGRQDLSVIIRRVAEFGLNLSLLLPVMTDAQLDMLNSRFETLCNLNSKAEVVVNDLGTLLYLKTRYPRLQCALGRLLNKGFKDPRLKLASDDDPGEEKPQELLNGSTFDQERFRRKMMDLGIDHLERDLLPYQESLGLKHSEPTAGYYFPYGYITSGRICWTATFKQLPEQKFIPAGKCRHTCSILSLRLKSNDVAFHTIQNGNTVFYLYPLEKLGLLTAETQTANMRLIYQGGVL